MDRLHQDPPLSNFFLGNAQTLGSVDKSDLLDALRNLYETKVSSHLMKLVIFTGKPIPEVKECVASFFSHIPKKSEASGFVWPLDFKSNQLIIFGSEKPSHQILITLPIFIGPKFPHHLRIIDYLLYLLRSTSEGSWLRHFEGQISTGSTQMSFSILGHHAHLYILLSAPLDSSDLINPITKTLQLYLEHLKKNAANKDLYEEFKFNIKRKQRTMLKDLDFVDNISEQMQCDKCALDWLILDKMKCNLKAISNFFSAINPELVNVTVAWGGMQKIKFDLIEPHYQISYQKTSLDTKGSMKNDTFIPKMPPKNEFSFLEEFYCKPNSKAYSTKEYTWPAKVVNPPWFKNDHFITSPEVALKLRFIIHPKADLRQSFKIALYFQLINDIIFYEVDRAEQAGMKIEFDNSNLCSIEVSIYGFGDQIPIEFLMKILGRANSILKDEKFDWEKRRATFDLFKSSLKSYSGPLNSVISHIFTRYLLRGDHISSDIIEGVVKDVTFNEFKKFVISDAMTKLLSAPQLFVMGTCLTKDHAMDINNSIRNIFQGFSPHKVTRKCFFKKNEVIKLNSTFSDNAILVSFKMTTKKNDIHGIALTILLVRTLSHHFLKELRLDEQLAYSLSLTTKIVQGESFLSFYIQSPNSPLELESRIIKYLNQDAVSYLDSLSVEHLNSVYQSVVQSVSFLPLQFQNAAKCLWDSIKLDLQIFNFLTKKYSIKQFLSDARTFLIKSDIDKSFRIIISQH